MRTSRVCIVLQRNQTNVHNKISHLPTDIIFPMVKILIREGARGSSLNFIERRCRENKKDALS
jgi:hypothetical protein